MKILITGGSGSIGQALVARLINSHDITIFSRHESSQVTMRQTYPSCHYIIGDVRDDWAVCSAIKGHDLVYHLASLKHVDVCERQPVEAIKTNIVGTMNVLQACQQYGIQMINMSTDKAANPLNTYGRTKRLAEDLVRGFALTLRSGNVVGSSGSLIPNVIQSIHSTNVVTLTDPRMTRFFISLDDISAVLADCIRLLPLIGVFIPGDMKSFYVQDVLKTLIIKWGNENTQMNISGIRPGEQLREYLCAKDESFKLHEFGLCEIIKESIKKDQDCLTSDDCLGIQEDLLKTFNL
jgi:UDP-N-acetylglucosamine 4,6-dehydratase/5-epimerase